MKPLEQKALQPNTLSILHSEAIIVLGGGTTQYAPNYPLSSDAFKRLVFGLSMARTLNKPLIYSGGGLNDYTESQGAKESIDQLSFGLGFSVPQLDIYQQRFGVLYEDQSLDTVENGQNIKKRYFLSNAKPHITLVTSAYHMWRSKVIFEKLGFTITIMPTDFKCNRTMEFTILDILPSQKGLNNSYIAIKEYVGLISVFIRHLNF